MEHSTLKVQLGKEEDSPFFMFVLTVQSDRFDILSKGENSQLTSHLELTHTRLLGLTDYTILYYVYICFSLVLNPRLVYFQTKKKNSSRIYRQENIPCYFNYMKVIYLSI